MQNFSTVHSKIEKLLDVFKSIQPSEVFPDGVILTYPLSDVFTNLIHRKLGNKRVSERDGKALKDNAIVNHYLNYLLGTRRLLLEDMGKSENNRDPLFVTRISGEFEKLLAHARAYLDAAFDLVYPFHDSHDIPDDKSECGSFLWWVYHKKPSLQPPLSFIAETAPWALTVSTLRNGGLHRAQAPTFFIGLPNVYVDFFPNRADRHKRYLPDVLYWKENPNNLIELEKFVVYICAPVIAIDQVLGEYFTWRFPQDYTDWNDFGGRTCGAAGALKQWFEKYSEMLSPSLYKEGYCLEFESRPSRKERRRKKERESETILDNKPQSDQKVVQMAGEN